MGMSQPPAEKFVWPPRKASPVDAAAHATLQKSRHAGRVPVVERPRGMWNAFESVFLDITAGPLIDRAAQAGWSADEIGDYCPRCGQSTLETEIGAKGCLRCSGINFAWERFVRLGEYRGELARWVREVKFTRWRRLGLDLGRLLGAQLAEAWRLSGGSERRPPVIVPVPDSPLRRVWRGIDHAAVIAGGAAAATGWPVVHPLVRRVGRSQLSVPPSERAANATKAFGLHKGIRLNELSGRVVVMMDDVVTTGATMRACCKLLTTACRRMDLAERPEVWAACLARTAVMPEAGKRRGTP